MYELYGFLYAFTKGRHASLVRGRGEERVDVAWLFFCAVSGDRRVLIDTGCSDERLMGKQNASGFRNPAELLKGISVEPSQITDVIVTHMHWDHVADVGLYDKATVYVQRQALEEARAVVSEERPHFQAFRLVDVRKLEDLDSRGRLELLDGDKDIAPGLSARLAGGHSPGLQYAVVATAKGQIVLASDNAYLYENVETETPPLLCAEPERAKQVLRDMKALASQPQLVIPGHDPAIAKFFPKVADRVFRLA